MCRAHMNKTMMFSNDLNKWTDIILLLDLKIQYEKEANSSYIPFCI